MAIWIGATLMIISLAPIAIRMGLVYLDAFSRDLAGALDAEWLQRALSDNLWATARMLIVAVLGSLLLTAGLISKWRATRKMTAESAKV